MSSSRPTFGSQLQLYRERVWSNPHLGNLLNCIAIIFVLFHIPWIVLLYLSIDAPSKERIGWCVGTFLNAASWTSYFVGVRHEELRDLWNLVALTLIITSGCLPAFTIGLPIFIFLSFWYLLSNLVVFEKPRFSDEPYEGDPRNEAMCKTCKELIKSSKLIFGSSWWLVRPVERHTHRLIQEVAVSKVACHFCSFLSRSLTQKHNSMGEETATTYGSCTIRRVEPPQRLIIKIWQERYLALPSQLRLQAEPSQTYGSEPLFIDVLHKGIVRHESNSSAITQSLSLMGLARSWIDACCNHSLCQNNLLTPSQKSFRPKRLVHVQPGSPPRLNLLETSGIELHQKIEWIALSHCWGGADIKQLLVNNLADLEESIAFDELPLSFQHAVMATLKLGFQYTWIDSLCIIQDCREDWESEAPQMGLVYANAVCTISATSAKDSNGGCFHQRDPLLKDCVLGRQGDLSLVVRSWTREESVLDELFEQIESSAVSRRGWTFQERVLSKRILHFCNGVIMFECNTMRASEFHEGGLPYMKRANVRADGKLHSSAVLQRLEREDEQFLKTVISRRRKGTSTRPFRRPPKDWTQTYTDVLRNYDYKSKEQKKEELLQLSALSGMRGAFQLVVRTKESGLAEQIEFHQCWFEMVEQYSTRSLTKHEDKLMAIAGIGSLIQQYTGRQFLCGLWKGALSLNLLWKRQESSSLLARPLRRIPTWSWASVDGPITHKLKALPREHQEDLKQAQDPEPSAIFRTTWEHVESLIVEENFEPYEIYQGIVHHAALKLSVRLFTLDNEMIFDPDIPVDRTTQSLVGMPILKFKNEHVAPFTSHIQIHGLVLRAVLSQQNTFERVGYFSRTDDEWAGWLQANLQERRSIWLV